MEAQFQPSTMYGLSPLQLAAQAANINQTVAQTHATRQSMMARAQDMKRQKELAGQEDMRYKQQQEQYGILMPAIQAKAQADRESALSEVKNFAATNQLKAEWAGNTDYWNGAMADALDRPSNEEKLSALSQLGVKATKYVPLVEGKAYLDAISNARQGVFNEQMKTMQYNAQLEAAREATRRTLGAQDMRNTQQDENNALKKQLEEAKLLAKQQQDAQTNRMKAIGEQIKTKMGALTKKMQAGDKAIDIDGLNKELQSIYDLNGQFGSGASPSQEKKPNVRQNGTEYTWNGSEYVPVQ